MLFRSNTSTRYAGSYSAQAGLSAPTNGDSKLSQTVIAPAGATKITFWYYNVCLGGGTSRDYAMATLYDATALKTTTVLSKTCTLAGTWRQVTASVVVGRTYTLTLINHDDNRVGQGTYSLFDSVTFT